MPDDEYEDLLGTGTVMRHILKRGDEHLSDDGMEPPRKFFALIDIETKCNGKRIESESYKNFLLSNDADLFPGAHLVVPLMAINETSRFKFHSKFCFGEQGLLPDIPPDSELECEITLKLRCEYEDFLGQLNECERVQLAERKKERGRFWFSRNDYQRAITVYKSLTELCNTEELVM